MSLHKSLLLTLQKNKFLYLGSENPITLSTILVFSTLYYSALKLQGVFSLKEEPKYTDPKQYKIKLKANNKKEVIFTV